MHSERARELLQKYIDRTITADEAGELPRLIRSEEDSIEDAVEYLLDKAPVMEGYRAEEWETVYERIERRLPGRTVRWWPMVAAAMVLIVAGAYMLLPLRPAPKAPAVLAH